MGELYAPPPKSTPFAERSGDPIPSASPPSSRPFQRLAPLLICVLSVAVGFMALDTSPVGVYYDDALYAVLAKSIATGHGYRYLNLPGTPVANHYPPGYPVFLALLWRLVPSFPQNVALMKGANVAFLGVTATGLFTLARRRLQLSARAALGAALLGALSIPSLLLTTTLLSEPMFLAGLVIFLIYAEQETGPLREQHSSRERTLRAIALWAATGLLTLVRSHGIVLVPAVGAAYLLRRRGREAIASAAASILVLAPWVMWVSMHEGGIPPLLRGTYGSYSGWYVRGLHAQGLALPWRTTLGNMGAITELFTRFVSPVERSYVDMIALAALLVLGVAGMVQLARTARVTLGFLVLYLAIVVVWPFSPLRFVWGIWPLLTILPFAGARLLWTLRSTRVSMPVLRSGVACSAALLLSGTIWFDVRGYANDWWSSSSRKQVPKLQAQFAWVQANTAPSDVVATESDPAVYLYTGRHSVPLSTFTAEEYRLPRSAEGDARVLRELIDYYGVRYTLVNTTYMQEAVRLLARAQPALLARADTMAVGAVFARVPPPTTAGRR